ncbi:FAD/NAD(P)-binding protein [Roseomonas sp. CCTCC AB2023176]|uniref:FAD/NAD(P)-binding protein n=1 Tax=Roseomonas sp. CCTCC AB2023176 TaxID=3342640 RepID=UPI0035E0FD30
MSPKSPVLVIGAGFTGTALAVQLARRGVPVALFDPATPGAGVAYGTQEPIHLLNVHARNMSALADEPEHFYRWTSTRDPAEFGPLCPAPGPDAFVPRLLYGRYMRDLLAGVEGVTHHPLRATAVRRDGAGFVMEPAGIHGRAVALCLGNPPPRPMAEGPGVIHDPWAPGALDPIGEDDAVLVLGTGLTTADVILSLRERRGHRGAIHAVSRHGWAPLPQVEPRPPARPAGPFRVERGLAQAMRSLRAHCAEEPWQAGFDGLRPQTTPAWRAMDAAARRRFLRHGRTAWNIHRHRLAPVVAARLAAEQEAGGLTLHAARLASFAPGDARLQRRGGAEASVAAQWLINCTGPDNAGGLLAQPLVRGLVETGLLSPDPYGLGMLTDPETLEASPGLYLLGPATRATFWEATAVPELRVQAEKVATHLAGRVVPA